MSANRPFYVRVLKTYDEWIEVQAITMDEAGEEAMRQPGVARVLEISYEPGGVLT